LPNESKSRCGCAHCRVRTVFGPVMLITVGILFLVAEYTHYGFGQLWPVLLIVAGVLALLQSLAPRKGHIDS
jgi:hypothetical protein